MHANQLWVAVCFLGSAITGSAQMAKAPLPQPARTPRIATATWTDQATGLMWTAQDNGRDVTLRQAGAYCRNLRDGHSDWRLPTIDELRHIYDLNVSVPGTCCDIAGKYGLERTYHVRGNLQLTGTEWSKSEGNTPGEVQSFDFGVMGSGGKSESLDERLNADQRVLCVRGSGGPMGSPNSSSTRAPALTPVNSVPRLVVCDTDGEGSMHLKDGTPLEVTILPKGSKGNWSSERLFAALNVIGSVNISGTERQAPTTTAWAGEFALTKRGDGGRIPDQWEWRRNGEPIPLALLNFSYAGPKYQLIITKDASPTGQPLAFVGSCK